MLPLIEAIPGKARLTLEVETGAETRKARTVFAAPGVGLVVKRDEPGFASMRANIWNCVGRFGSDGALFLALMASKLPFDHETWASLGLATSRMRGEEDRERPRDRAHGGS